MLGQALTLLRAGQLKQAGELCDGVLLLDPGQPDALHMGGVIALQQGRLDKAIERLGRLTGLQPKNAGALSDLGLALQLAGRLAEAEMVLAAAVRERPDSPEAWNNLGNVLGGLGKDSEAADSYSRALALRPAFPEALSNLALAQLRLGLPNEALLGAEQALALRPGMAEALQAKAAALDVLGRPDEAIAVCEALAQQRPRSGTAYYDMGSIELHHGRMAEAASHLRQALALEPGQGEWHRLLAQIVPHRERDDEIAAMEAVYRHSATPASDRMRVAFGLGKALEDIGVHGEAFDYFLAGNRLKRAGLTYDPADSDRTFADIKAVFTADRFARQPMGGCPDPTPIFVLGMPRSGTSLVEQVIASHPGVRGGGEFTLLNRLVGSLGGGAAPFRFSERLAQATEEQLAALGQSYVAQIRELSSEARFITDKTPGNFLLIGMIRLMLPNARVVYCRRDPLDTCLSIFKTHFGSDGLRYAYDLAEIGHYYALHEDLMAHWHRVLPGFVHEVRYEALVADFAVEGPRLLEQCGLDWRPQCAAFFNTRRSVQTASSAQVRRPIYASSIGQSARYGDRLRPLFAALGK